MGDNSQYFIITINELYPGEGNGNPLQYFCLGNPMDRGAWWAIDYGVAKRVRHDLMTKQQMDYNLKKLCKNKNE